MKRFIKCFMIITAIFGLLAVSSCDTNGTASAPTARSANDALRAIPLISEVLGVGENGTQSLSAAGWMGALGEGEDDDEECAKHEDLCSIEDEIQQLLNTEFLITILRAMAAETPLQMNVVNQLGTRSTSFLCVDDEDRCGDFPEEADFGIVQVTEHSDRVHIQWVLPSAAQTDHPIDDTTTNYLDFVLHGWPNNVTQVDFWMIDDSVGALDFNYQYGELLIPQRAARVFRDNAERTGNPEQDEDPQGARIERMVFRSIDGGGMDGIALMDEDDDNNMRFVLSFRDVPNSHAAFARTPLEETSTSTLRLFRADDDATPVIEETTGGGGDHTTRWVHGQELDFRRTTPEEPEEATDADNTHFTEFLTRSTELYDEMMDFEMPLKPDIATHFPALPPLP